MSPSLVVFLLVSYGPLAALIEHTRFCSTASCAQVAYFGWYQMHASKQSRNMKEYYEQNPTTGEQMGEGVAVPGSD